MMAFRSRKIPKRQRLSIEPEPHLSTSSSSSSSSSSHPFDPLEQMISPKLVETLFHTQPPTYFADGILSSDQQQAEIVHRVTPDSGSSSIIFSTSQAFLEGIPNEASLAAAPCVPSEHVPPHLQVDPQVNPQVDPQVDPQVNDQSAPTPLSVEPVADRVTAIALEDVFPQVQGQLESATLAGALSMLKTLGTGVPKLETEKERKKRMREQGQAFHGTKTGVRRREQIARKLAKQQASSWNNTN